MDLTRSLVPATLLGGLAVASCSDGGPTVMDPDPLPPVEVPCVGDLCDDGLLRSYGYDDFYKKIFVTDGIPIISSQFVRDAALHAAATVVDSMLAGRATLRAQLVEGRAYVGVMAETEVTTDIPEHAFLSNDPNTNWDQRARGLGGTPERPITTVGEENLLCLAGDRYRGESILVHEFAHTIHLVGLARLDGAFQGLLSRAFEEARTAGLWDDTYAATNDREYWAEGVQSWFDTNQVPQSGIHNHVDTREELADYDPVLHDLIGAHLPASAWSPTCPAGS